MPQPLSRRLYKLAKAINATVVVDEVLQAIVQSTAQALGAKACSLMLLSPDGRQLLHTAAFGLSDWYMRKGPVRADQSIVESLQGQVVAVNDVPHDPRIQYRDQARREGIASILSLPLSLAGQPLGVMRVYTGEPHQFTRPQVAFATAVANLGAIAIANARLHQTLQPDLEAGRQDLLEFYAQRAEVPPPRAGFAHPSEGEFAHVLDFYRVRWQYEPRSFPLQWEDGRITEMFTPDFYLADLDLYIELTTMKQSLVTEKNRKLRRLRELYPEVNIRLLYRRDYHRLLAKYGFGPLGQVGEEKLGKVLFSAVDIERRVAELGQQISADYADRHPLLVGVLRGVVCFMADLIRHITLPLDMDFMAISSYEGDGGEAVRIVKDLSTVATGRDVILVEDIVDTGMTLYRIQNHLSSHQPHSLEVCTLLDKRVRRLVDVPLKYVGFEIPDEFVVGYGLDYGQEYRNLPFIALLRPGGEEPRMPRWRPRKKKAPAAAEAKESPK